MGQPFKEIGAQHRQFLAEQHMFFVATAAPDGRVNLSPKGLDTFRVLHAKQVAWLNLTGSGNETAAHLLENPRMTIMFCAFAGKPLILRLYGQARAVHPSEADWAMYAPQFAQIAGARQIFVMEVELVQTSCGMAVPLFDYQAQRDALVVWAEKKGEQGVAQYWQNKNQRSLDLKPTGMPPITAPNVTK